MFSSINSYIQIIIQEKVALTIIGLSLTRNTIIERLLCKIGGIAIFMKFEFQGGEGGLSFDELENMLRPLLHNFSPRFAGFVSEGTVKAVNAGYEDAAVVGTKALLRCKLEDFVRNVVLLIVREQHSDVIGRLSVAATKKGGAELIHKLSTELLVHGHVEEAALASAAFWDAGLESGLSQEEMAKVMAPAVIDAVTQGHAEDMARTQKRLLEMDKGLLAQWLLVTLVNVYNRLDIAALGTWVAVKQVKGGVYAVACIAGLAMLEGHCDVVADVAEKMYEFARKENDLDPAADVVALAAAQVASVSHPEAAVDVSERLIELGATDLVVATVDEMLRMGHVDEVGQITWSAVKQRKVKLVKILTDELVALGKWDAVLSTAGAAAGQACAELLTPKIGTDIQGKKR